VELDTQALSSLLRTKYPCYRYDVMFGGVSVTRRVSGVEQQETAWAVIARRDEPLTVTS